MKYDIFFSISQTPVEGVTPTEAEMFRSFFAQVEAADAQGFGTAWVAESHFSTQVQKAHASPVVPHWEGEIGLNANIFQLSQQVFSRTRRIETGAAVMNILTCGGPIAAAEKIATFLSLHGLDPEEQRRINVGFSAGRFEFMNRPFGIVPRDPVEEAAWPALRGQIFAEACRIFLRLLRGEVVSSEEIPETVLTRSLFRSDADWEKVQDAAGGRPEQIVIPRRYEFEPIQIVPKDWRRDLLQLIVGSHDPALQVMLNEVLPVQVFNLSITKPEVIDATHARMTRAYHPDGGPWRREYMPRTTFVFLNEQPHLSPTARRAAARDEARAALTAYWTALQGTIDPKKIEDAADNALVGDAEAVAQQILERFHPDDRLMLWFDFFNHDSDRVIANQEAFMEAVAPRVAEGLGR
jgi:alkanesulfonate monooxygenase SsuD/methylene tetrahydromethanopterin reductase-like flavin-dependent oxidoreductase (luciferase family)